MVEKDKKQMSVFIDADIADEFLGVCDRAGINKSARLQFLIEQDLPVLKEAEKKLIK
jgi:hypothetical protein